MKNLKKLMILFLIVPVLITFASCSFGGGNSNGNNNGNQNQDRISSYTLPQNFKIEFGYTNGSTQTKATTVKIGNDWYTKTITGPEYFFKYKKSDDGFDYKVYLFNNSQWTFDHYATFEGICKLKTEQQDNQYKFSFFFLFKSGTHDILTNETLNIGGVDKAVDKIFRSNVNTDSTTSCAEYYLVPDYSIALKYYSYTLSPDQETRSNQTVYEAFYYSDTITSFESLGISVPTL